MDSQTLFPTVWYSLDWFYPATFQNFTWEYKQMLWLLWGIPLVFLIKYIIQSRIKQKLLIALPKSSLKWKPASLLRFIPDLLIALILALIIICIARPQKTDEKVEQWTEGIDIMLVIDISESMQIEDFKPNRLEAAKETAFRFIAGRFQDRIGIVIFSGDAYSL